MSVLKFLLKHDKTKCNIDINDKDLNLLTQACNHEQYNIVKYLTSSKELEVLADPTVDYWSIFWSCSKGNLEITDYLLTNFPKIDIHYSGDSSFEMALNKNNMNIIDYLIFDYDIQITDKISKFIENNDLVRNKFILRELNRNLNKELPKNLDKVNIFKI